MTTTAPPRPFIAADLKVHPALRQLALDYLDTYQGGFEFLVSAKVMANFGNIPESAIKGVLNCMRTDYSVQWPDLDWSGQKSAPLPVTPTKKKVRPPSDRASVKVLAKFAYVYSMRKNACLVHVVDARQTKGVWYRRGYSFGIYRASIDGSFIDVIIGSQCGRTWHSMPRYGDHKLQLVTFDDWINMPSGYKICPTCITKSWPTPQEPNQGATHA